MNNFNYIKCLKFNIYCLFRRCELTYSISFINTFQIYVKVHFFRLIKIDPLITVKHPFFQNLTPTYDTWVLFITWSKPHGIFAFLIRYVLTRPFSLIGYDHDLSSDFIILLANRHEHIFGSSNHKAKIASLQTFAKFHLEFIIECIHLLW